MENLIQNRRLAVKALSMKNTGISLYLRVSWTQILKYKLIKITIMKFKENDNGTLSPGEKIELSGVYKYQEEYDKPLSFGKTNADGYKELYPNKN